MTWGYLLLDYLRTANLDDVRCNTVQGEEVDLTAVPRDQLDLTD